MDNWQILDKFKGYGAAYQIRIHIVDNGAPPYKVRISNEEGVTFTSEGNTNIRLETPKDTVEQYTIEISGCEPEHLVWVIIELPEIA